MTNKEEEFLKRLQAMFKIEAKEHITALSSGLIELEKNPESKKSQELIETIFREVHSLKGAARAVNRLDIESICQVLESTFAKLKNENLSFTSSHFDSIHNAIDSISKMLSGTETKITDSSSDIIKQLQTITETASPEKKTKEETQKIIKVSEEKPEPILPPTPIVESLLSKLTSNENLPFVEIKQTKKSIKSEPQDKPYEENAFQIDTVRIQTAKLDPIFLEAEQMIQSKIAYAQRNLELNNIYDYIIAWKAELRKWDSMHIADKELQLKEIINLTNKKLDETERNIFTVSRAIESDQRTLGRMIDEHVESTKKILMHPISLIVEGFPKLVRDLARSQKKEVELKIVGKEIEVDKRILEELKDPLVHLIRNCVDHGIRKPDERLKINKAKQAVPASRQGTITLCFSVVDGRNLKISISDDGSGINTEKVIIEAIKLGITSKEKADKLSNQEILSLIFKTGLSTSPIITDISGRGLGLAIVREKVEKLNGTITIENKPNIGTTFNLIMPLTLSTFRGVLVSVAEQQFFLPTINVDCALRLSKEEIKTVENRETILIGEDIIGVVKLSDVLGIYDRKQESADFIQIIVLNQADTRIGFKVDEIFDEHQILVKELGKQLNRVRNISGATVLGSGIVVAVINVSDLMKSALGSTILSAIKEDKKQDIATLYKILVIDDSITSRTLIKNILETSGYDVTTAVDGVDAYTKALIGDFDLIVSDVDMPRMNGFELTEKIRKEKKLSEIPVVLVTALESREDREHGIDVGANAYIIKSSFDQSNLLEVVKKLL